MNGAPTFDLKSRRHVGEGGFEFLVAPESSIKVNLRHTTREGAQPFGGSFGHSQVVEFAAPIDHKLTDFDASAELERGRVLLRAGYTGSWFTNDITSVIFDNPLRATDISGTPSAGRLSMPVSNTRLGVNGMASVKLPKKSRLTVRRGEHAQGRQRRDSAFNHQHRVDRSLYRLQPDRDQRRFQNHGAQSQFRLAPLGEGERQREYRYFDFDNRTHEFKSTLRVSYDSSWSTPAAPAQSEPFGMSGRRSMAMSGSMWPGPWP